MAGADHRVTDRTVTALGRAERAGLRTVIVTGRSYPTALSVWQKAELSAPLITCGGALTLQPPQMGVVRSVPIPDGMVAEALRLGEEFDLTVSLWTQRRVWVTRPGKVQELLSAINEMPVPVITPGPEAPRPAGPLPVIKIMLGGPPELVDRAAVPAPQRLPLLDVARSMPEFIEATMPEASKHEALKGVLADLGVEPSAVIAMGDAETDMGMLSMAGLAAVPASAMPVARAVAGRIIGHHDREAVAEFVEELLRLRGEG